MSERFFECFEGSELGVVSSYILLLIAEQISKYGIIVIEASDIPRLAITLIRFRTSPWDPSENLPITYARIFKFADYRHSKKVALASVDELSDEGRVVRGAYVTIYIASVPSRLMGGLFCFCSPEVTLTGVRCRL